MPCPPAAVPMTSWGLQTPCWKPLLHILGWHWCCETYLITTCNLSRFSWSLDSLHLFSAAPSHQTSSGPSCFWTETLVRVSSCHRHCAETMQSQQTQVSWRDRERTTAWRTGIQQAVWGPDRCLCHGGWDSTFHIEDEGRRQIKQGFAKVLMRRKEGSERVYMYVTWPKTSQNWYLQKGSVKGGDVGGLGGGINGNVISY